MQISEPEFETYTENPATASPRTCRSAMVKADQYDGLVIPGGRAPEYIRNEPHALEIVEHFMEAATNQSRRSATRRRF